MCVRTLLLIYSCDYDNKKHVKRTIISSGLKELEVWGSDPNRKQLIPIKSTIETIHHVLETEALILVQDALSGSHDTDLS